MRQSKTKSNAENETFERKTTSRCAIIHKRKQKTNGLTQNKTLSHMHLHKKWEEINRNKKNRRTQSKSRDQRNPATLKRAD